MHYHKPSSNTGKLIGSLPVAIDDRRQLIEIVLSSTFAKEIFVRNLFENKIFGLSTVGDGGYGRVYPFRPLKTGQIETV